MWWWWWWGGGEVVVPPLLGPTALKTCSLNAPPLCSTTHRLTGTLSQQRQGGDVGGKRVEGRDEDMFGDRDW